MAKKKKINEKISNGWDITIKILSAVIIFAFFTSLYYVFADYISSNKWFVLIASTIIIIIAVTFGIIKYDLIAKKLKKIFD